MTSGGGTQVRRRQVAAASKRRRPTRLEVAPQYRVAADGFLASGARLIPIDCLPILHSHQRMTLYGERNVGLVTGYLASDSGASPMMMWQLTARMSNSLDG
jgi:hypothetical protein